MNTITPIGCFAAAVLLTACAKEVEQQATIDNHLSQQPPLPAEKEEVTVQDMAQEPVRMAPGGEAASDMPSINVRATLDHLRKLLAQGESEQAHSEYVQLRNSCPDCGLPESLEEALEVSASQSQGQ